MNILFQTFPEMVEVQGRRYKIVTDFREWIKLQELLQNAEKVTPDVCRMILEWYIDTPPSDLESAIYALQDFLSAEAIYPERNTGEIPGGDEARKPGKVFSFSQDAVCIYCAFLSVYGIDIETVKYMHWWKFKALFDGLPTDTEIKERIYYRSLDLNDIKDKEERKRIKEIKKRIALKEHKRKLSDYQIGEMF